MMSFLFFFVSESERDKWEVRKERRSMTLWCIAAWDVKSSEVSYFPPKPLKRPHHPGDTISRILSGPWYPQEGCEQEGPEEVDSVGRMWEGLRLHVFFLCLGAALWSAAAAATYRGSGLRERGHRRHLSLHRHRERGKEGQVLHRSKRGWVWNQFFVIEEYTGPDPVLVGRVSRKKQLLHPFFLVLSPLLHLPPSFFYPKVMLWMKVIGVFITDRVLAISSICSTKAISGPLD